MQSALVSQAMGHLECWRGTDTTNLQWRLAAGGKDAQAFEARSQAATQAESSYQIASQRYAAGGISQLAMLNVQCQQLQTTLDRIAYQAAATLFVTLFQAPGGGWWNEKQASGVIGASHSSRLP